MEAPKSLSEGGNWSRCELPRFPPPLWVHVRRVFSPGLAVATWLSAFLCFPGGREGTSLPCGPHSSVATSRWQVLTHWGGYKSSLWASQFSGNFKMAGPNSGGLLCSSPLGPGPLEDPGSDRSGQPASGLTQCAVFYKSALSEMF